jgi:hypothetical protein
MLVHHADADGERRRRIARRQRLAERLDRAGIGDVVSEQNRHQRRLAGAVLAEQREDLAAREIQRYRVVRDDGAEAFADAGQAQDRAGAAAPTARRHLAVDLGSVSITATLNFPSRMSFSFAFTRATRSAGTFDANVPSGASSEPLYFISEYWP